MLNKTSASYIIMVASNISGNISSPGSSHAVLSFTFLNLRDAQMESKKMSRQMNLEKTHVIPSDCILNILIFPHPWTDDMLTIDFWVQFKVLVTTNKTFHGVGTGLFPSVFSCPIRYGRVDIFQILSGEKETFLNDSICPLQNCSLQRSDVFNFSGFP